MDGREGSLSIRVHPSASASLIPSIQLSIYLSPTVDISHSLFVVIKNLPIDLHRTADEHNNKEAMNESLFTSNKSQPTANK